MCLQQEFTDLLTKLHETIKEVCHYSLISICNRHGYKILFFGSEVLAVMSSKSCCNGYNNNNDRLTAFDPGQPG